MNVGLPSFFKQETAQCLLLAVGALWLFWQNGAPMCVLWMVSGLGGLYILGEKVRASYHPKAPDTS